MEYSTTPRVGESFAPAFAADLRGIIIAAKRHLGDVSGYERVSGSSRRYRNVVTGETISRRQYDNLRIQAGASPFKNRSQIERYRSGRNLEVQRYKRIGAARDRLSPKKRGIDPDWDRGEDLESDFARLYADAKANRTDLSPYGPLAQFLSYIGLRDADADYDVGETQVT